MLRDFKDRLFRNGLTSMKSWATWLCVILALVCQGCFGYVRNRLNDAHDCVFYKAGVGCGVSASAQVFPLNFGAGGHYLYGPGKGWWTSPPAILEENYYGLPINVGIALAGTGHGDPTLKGLLLTSICERRTKKVEHRSDLKDNQHHVDSLFDEKIENPSWVQYGSYGGWAFYTVVDSGKYSDGVLELPGAASLYLHSADVQVDISPHSISNF